MIRNGVKTRTALEHTCGLERGEMPEDCGLVNIGDTVQPKKGYFMPYWEYGAIVVKVGMPMIHEKDIPKHPGGDWIIISSYGGWLPRIKFQKQSN